MKQLRQWQVWLNPTLEASEWPCPPRPALNHSFLNALMKKNFCRKFGQSYETHTWKQNKKKTFSSNRKWKRLSLEESSLSGNPDCPASGLWTHSLPSIRNREGCRFEAPKPLLTFFIQFVYLLSDGSFPLSVSSTPKMHIGLWSVTDEWTTPSHDHPLLNSQKPLLRSSISCFFSYWKRSQLWLLSQWSVE